MMSIYLLFLTVISFVKAQTITSVTNMKKEDTGFRMSINCSSSEPPFGFTAEFLVNNILEFSIRNFKNQCFIEHRECLKDECICTAKSYTVHFHVNLEDHYNSFTCQMRFQNRGKEGGHKLVENTALYNQTEIYDQIEVIALRGGRQESISEKKKQATDIEKESSLRWIYIIVGIAIASAIIIVAAVYYLRKAWKGKTTDTKYQDEELQPFMDVNESEKEITCDMCTEMSVSAFCSDCEQFFCTNCCDRHVESNLEHKLGQIDNMVTNNAELNCKFCTRRVAEKVCVDCKKEVCSACCEHHTSSDGKHIMKMLVMTHGRRRKRLDTDRSSNIQYRYSIAAEEENTRICGVCVLSRDQILICDTNYRQLKIYQTNTLHIKHDLEIEPNSMTNISDDQIAITYPHERQIKLYEIGKSSVMETHSFQLKDKPFSIAYNRQHLVVEMGLGDGGKIIVMDTKGMIKHTVGNYQQFGYFTGNTMRLALDMNKKKVFVSEICKKGVYCVDFEGNILWNKAITTPRSIIFVNDILNDNDIIFSSKKSNAIFLMNSNNGRKDILIANGKINQPRYIDYNLEKKKLCIQVYTGEILVYTFDITEIE